MAPAHAGTVEPAGEAMKRPKPPNIAAMADQLGKIQEEFDVAIAAHASWRPAAYDADLHSRMGVSYATNTFNIIRGALWRECVLALGRIWDRDQNTIKLTAMRRDLEHPDFMDVLMAHRKTRSVPPEIEAMMRDQLREKAARLAETLASFDQRGSRSSAIEHLRTVRNSLAHRPLSAASIGEVTLDDTQLEEIFNGTAEVISGLWSLLAATAYSPLEANGVWSHYARHFWTHVRGER